MLFILLSVCTALCEYLLQLKTGIVSILMVAYCRMKTIGYSIFEDGFISLKLREIYLYLNPCLVTISF